MKMRISTRHKQKVQRNFESLGDKKQQLKEIIYYYLKEVTIR